jgi:hypothetical protein
VRRYWGNIFAQGWKTLFEHSLIAPEIVGIEDSWFRKTVYLERFIHFCQVVSELGMSLCRDEITDANLTLAICDSEQRIEDFLALDFTNMLHDLVSG